MCDRQIQYADTLVSPQSQGTILMMLAWFFACLLALCTVTRIIARYKLRRHPQFPVSDDAIVVTAALCALGSTLVISTAVDSGLGKLQCLLDSTDIDRIQVKIFVATILSVLALSIPKCSVLIFFYRVAHSTLQRIGVVTLGCLVLLWTIAVISGTVFQCAMPQPWTIWTGKCIPLATFHITTTIASTILDTTLLLISLQLTWTQTTSYHYKTLASFLLSLRLLTTTTTPTPTITKEPLPSIQASMSHPNLPSRSRWSGDEDELLPEVRLPVAKPRGNKPRRPPRPMTPIYEVRKRTLVISQRSRSRCIPPPSSTACTQAFHLHAALSHPSVPRVVK
ncbi:predicted protein [Plenodomus lingam JN3]|uniref:Predicted protein n=1 Tax=Leptosphaeria maculans (strain JN3 / isolate v23.1.3 / race Av1-4-5-6-7-8) TaxID=985895 RepID=E5A2H4_LEPMJ|nr:predicted protein [Plenodomus lingam JN3]CBX97770.1 predicted protein [Plenodomus lingam JN3]